VESFSKFNKFRTGLTISMSVFEQVCDSYIDTHTFAIYYIPCSTTSKTTHVACHLCWLLELIPFCNSPFPAGVLYSTAPAVEGKH